MSTISWFSIFSGFSARLIRSLMFDRISVETVKDSHENPRCAGGASLSRAQLTLPPLVEHALGEIYALGELGDLSLEVRHLCFQRRHPLGILALGAPAPLSPPPDTRSEE